MQAMKCQRIDPRLICERPRLGELRVATGFWLTPMWATADRAISPRPCSRSGAATKALSTGTRSAPSAPTLAAIPGARAMRCAIQRADGRPALLDPHDRGHDQAGVGQQFAQSRLGWKAQLCRQRRWWRLRPTDRGDSGCETRRELVAFALGPCHDRHVSTGL